MEENKKIAFLSKVEEFANEMKKVVNAKGAKRSIIVIASEEVEHEEKTISLSVLQGMEVNLSIQ